MLSCLFPSAVTEIRFSFIKTLIRAAQPSCAIYLSICHSFHLFFFCPFLSFFVLSIVHYLFLSIVPFTVAFLSFFPFSCSFFLQLFLASFLLFSIHCSFLFLLFCFYHHSLSIHCSFPFHHLFFLSLFVISLPSFVLCFHCSFVRSFVLTFFL